MPDGVQTRLGSPPWPEAHSTDPGCSSANPAPLHTSSKCKTLPPAHISSYEAAALNHSTRGQLFPGTLRIPSLNPWLCAASAPLLNIPMAGSAKALHPFQSSLSSRHNFVDKIKPPHRPWKHNLQGRGRAHQHLDFQQPTLKHHGGPAGRWIARAPSSGDPTPKNPQSWTFGVGIPLIPQGRLGALLAVCSAMGGGGKSRKCEQEESMTYGRGGMLQQGRGEREGGGGVHPGKQGFC